MNVLLIGDSIRIFYEEDVRTRLGDTCRAYASEETAVFLPMY